MILVFEFLSTLAPFLSLACFGPLTAHTQVLRVPSSLALMILVLSNATARTMPSWPRRVMVHSPVVRSVTVMVPSVLQDTTYKVGHVYARACMVSKQDSKRVGSGELRDEHPNLGDSGGKAVPPVDGCLGLLCAKP